MARSGMTNLIYRLRRIVDDANATVWTDDDVQDSLDAHQQRVWREPLEYELTRTSGTTYVWKEYRSRWGNFEQGGTAYFKVEDSAGSARGTADYSVDYLNGVITMTADQLGTALYLTGYTYDLNGAAADLWRERATKVTSYYDVSTDGHNLSRSQWHKHCMENAEMYAKKAKAVTRRQWTSGEF